MSNGSLIDHWLAGMSAQMLMTPVEHSFLSRYSLSDTAVVGSQLPAQLSMIPYLPGEGLWI